MPGSLGARFFALPSLLFALPHHSQRGLPCDNTNENLVAGFLMYGSYFALFALFALGKYAGPQKKREAMKKSGKGQKDAATPVAAAAAAPMPAREKTEKKPARSPTPAKASTPTAAKASTPVSAKPAAAAKRRRATSRASRK